MGKAKGWGLFGLILLLFVFAYWFLADVKEKRESIDTTDELDRTEEMEKNRIRNFFDELNAIYGYYYRAEDYSFQLLLTIDEALYEGEISGSLLLMERTGDKQNEARFEWSGITDGYIIKLYMTVDGEQKLMEGSFHGDTASFDVNFWTTNQKVMFQAVTEEEYKQRYEEY